MSAHRYRIVCAHRVCANTYDDRIEAEADAKKLDTFYDCGKHRVEEVPDGE